MDKTNKEQDSDLRFAKSYQKLWEDKFGLSLKGLVMDVLLPSKFLLLFLTPKATSSQISVIVLLNLVIKNSFH